MQKVLLTGANGFVGEHLLSALIDRGFFVIAPTRGSIYRSMLNFENPLIDNLSDVARLIESRDDIDVVIHLAGVAHQPGVSEQDFTTINAENTEEIGLSAVSKNISKFFFFSSIGVNGNETTVPFKSIDVPRPTEPYAVSKLDAEQRLKRVFNEQSQALVIIRPPLIYGPTAPGNFAKMLQLVRSGFPLPFASIENKRSFISIFNLCDFVLHCMQQIKPGTYTYLVSDNDDVSTSRLLELMYASLGQSNRLFTLNYKLMMNVLGLIGKAHILHKLCCDLQVDCGDTMERLAWSPPFSVEESLSMTFGSKN